MRLRRILLVIALALAAVGAGGQLAQAATARIRATVHTSAAPGTRGPSVPPAVHRASQPRPALSGGDSFTSTTNNWAGYVASGGTYTTVTSSWIQPAVACPAATGTTVPAAAFWVGLDGWSDTSVEQTGTWADCSNGTPHYRAWYEFYPASPVYYSDTVAVGDTITASVQYEGNGYYAVDLADINRGWTEDHTFTSSGDADDSAEVVAEAPGSSSGEVPLADYGDITFQNSTIDGGSLAAAGAQPVNMAIGSNTLAMTSAQDSSGQFGVADYAAVQTALQFPNGNLGLDTTNGDSNLVLPMAAATSPSYSSGPGTSEIAVQNSNGQLALDNPGSGSTSTGLGMAAGTSPAVAELSNGSYEVAFQSSTGYLSTYSSSTQGLHTTLGMAAGTSPSIIPMGNGSYVIAFQANTGYLWTYTPSTGTQIPLGMAAGTSPAIAELPGSGSYEIAFQANTGYLWTYTPSGGGTQIPLGMAAGTSPSIAAQANTGTYGIAFQANTGHLWTYTPSAGGTDEGVAMASGTSPSISPMPDGFVTAYQASDTDLALEGNFGSLDTGYPLNGHSDPSIIGNVLP